MGTSSPAASAILSSVLDNVRTRVLSLALDLEAVMPEAGEPMLFGEGHCIVIDATNHAVKREAAQGLATWEECTKRASYRTSTSTVPDEWLKDSTDHPGSWWENWHDWIDKRAPASKPAAKALVGGDTYPPLAAAPGDCVRRRLT
jgi:hypothetical protein